MCKKYLITFTFLMCFLIPFGAAQGLVNPNQEASFTTYTGNLTNFSQMQDVSISSPLNNQHLTWNSLVGKWVNSYIAETPFIENSTSIYAINSGKDFSIPNSNLFAKDANFDGDLYVGDISSTNRNTINIYRQSNDLVNWGGIDMDLDDTGKRARFAYFDNKGNVSGLEIDSDNLYHALEGEGLFKVYTEKNLFSNSQLANGNNYWNDSFATFNKSFADTLYSPIGLSTGYWNLTGNNLYPKILNYNVGIGTTSPSQKLDVNGNVNIADGSAYMYNGVNALRLTKGTAPIYGNTHLGYQAGDTSFGNSKTLLGFQAGKSSTGSTQVLIGALAGVGSSAAELIAIGSETGTGSSGSSSIMMGTYSGYDNTGFNQIAIGYDAGDTNTGSSQISIGAYSGYINSGANQIAIGESAGDGNSGISQTAIGKNSGKSNSGTYQTAIGETAGQNNIGEFQTAIGYNAGKGNKELDQTAIGKDAGSNNNGNGQTAVGKSAGAGNSGIFQSSYGSRAGSGNTGNFQTVIGSNAGDSNSGINQLAIGNTAGFYNMGASQTVIGASAGSRNEGDNVTSVGFESTKDNIGNNVVALGFQAGLGNTENNKFIVQQNNINTIPLIKGDFATGLVNMYGGINITGNSTFWDNIRVEGELIGGSPLKMQSCVQYYAQDNLTDKKYSIYASSNNQSECVSSSAYDKYSNALIFQNDGINGDVNTSVVWWNNIYNESRFALAEKDGYANTFRGNLIITNSSKLDGENLFTKCDGNFIDCLGGDMLIDNDLEVKSDIYFGNYFKYNSTEGKLGIGIFNDTYKPFDGTNSLDKGIHIYNGNPALILEDVNGAKISFQAGSGALFYLKDEDTNKEILKINNDNSAEWNVSSYNIHNGNNVALNLIGDNFVENSTRLGWWETNYENNGIDASYDSDLNILSWYDWTSGTRDNEPLMQIKRGTNSVETRNLEVTNLKGTYIGGKAYVCVYDNGEIFASETAC